MELKTLHPELLPNKDEVLTETEIEFLKLVNLILRTPYYQPSPELPQEEMDRQWKANEELFESVKTELAKFDFMPENFFTIVEEDGCPPDLESTYAFLTDWWLDELITKKLTDWGNAPSVTFQM